MNVYSRLTVIGYWGLPLILAIILPSVAFARNGQEHPAAVRDERTWTLYAGLGSSKAWNLVGITKEFFVGDHASAFITAGLGEMILGAGIAFYGNREGSGVVASAVTGTGHQFTLTYRRKLGRLDFLAFGGTYVREFGFSDIDKPEVLPVCAYEHRF